MAVEQAQRLIAMSLGKIAASRSQRGGANLHKSLLVSTVLHKARTTIMMESFQAMMQQRKAQMEASQQVEISDERPPTPAPAYMAAETAERTEEPQWNKENSSHSEPRKDYHNMMVADRPTPLQQSSVDNMPLANNNNNCAKCLKRRSSEILEGEISAKRCKYESDCELSQDMNSRADCVFSSENDISSSELSTPEPMQTDPVQITTLVHRFNSGLSGLLSQASHANDQQYTSCCTQVKDSQIDSLSRPCIALTVWVGSYWSREALNLLVSGMWSPAQSYAPVCAISDGGDSSRWGD